MKYLGGKQALAKELLVVMLQYKRPEQYWVEPFVGGGNVIEHIIGPRIGADMNPYAIQALTSIRDCLHELPQNNDEFGEEQYKSLRKSDDYKHKGFAGFAYSFGAKWLGGWARDKDFSDYVKIAYSAATEQSPKLQGCELVHSDYLSLPIPPKSLIYCDPPYQKTTAYTSKIDHERFWCWCAEKSIEGHTVFVSEFTGPAFAKIVWSKKRKIKLGISPLIKEKTEKLFFINLQLKIKNIY